MSDTNKSNGVALITLALLLVGFVVIFVLIKKLFSSLNTEPTVLDEASKKILNDEKLVEDYYAAIEKEKKGESVNITIEGEKYKIIRAGKYTQPVTTH